IVRQLGSARAFLRRIGECSNSLEANFLEKFEQLRELRFGLPWKSNNAGCPNRNTGYGIAEARNFFPDCSFPLRPAHARENVVSSVLHRHIEVRKNSLFAGND